MGEGEAPATGWQVHLEAIQHIQEGVQVFDPELRYLYVNPAAAAQGRTVPERLVGRTLLEAYPEAEDTEMLQRLRQCLRTGISDRMENAFLFSDGSQRWFELRMAPVPDGVLLLSIDIHQRKVLEEQVHHAQRMEAVGRLAGGVAHDFNNLLTIIQTYAALLEPQLPEAARADARQILQAAERGANLTRQLLTIGCRQTHRPVAVDLDATLGELEPMLARLLNESHALDLVLDCGGSVLLGEGQLDQVLFNLTANASDAMPDGGRLVIRTTRVEVDQAYAELHLDIAPGTYALLTVSDTGMGMDAETRSRIFEPFFTTRREAGGTGLGLATTHGIITQAKGHIWVYSEPGTGTTLKIFLPMVVAPVQPAPAPPEEVVELAGTETVMVVDDEPALAELCSRFLSDLGYTVLIAAGMEEAVRFSRQYSGAIHAVITDVVMPGGSGPELVARLRERRPHLRMLYMSGYVDDERILAMNHAAFLEKPFTPKQLARKLRELLQPL